MVLSCALCVVLSVGVVRSFEREKKGDDENISWRPAVRSLYDVKIFVNFYWVRKFVGVPASWKMATLEEFSDS